MEFNLFKLHSFNTSTPENKINSIRSACQLFDITMNEQQAYILATVEHETHDTFDPVEEKYFISSDWNIAEAWRKANLPYYPWYGRGHIQTTFEKNYIYFSNLMGIDFIADPKQMLVPVNSLYIMAYAFVSGYFNTDDNYKSLNQYINNQKIDYIGARYLINVQDEAAYIASLVPKYLLK